VKSVEELFVIDSNVGSLGLVHFNTGINVSTVTSSILSLIGVDIFERDSINFLYEYVVGVGVVI
jgi:hypothetical protein